MFKKQLLFIGIMTLGLCSYGQNSPKAKALLDDVYTKAMSYDNIYIDFNSTLENTEANLKQETNGNVTISGDKYMLDYLGAQQLNDGKKVYTIVPENEEVTIEDVNEDNNVVTPSKMLTFYRTGHNYQWDILQNVGGRKIQYVKLTPIDSNTEIKSILLGVDVQTKHIYKLIQIGENSTKTSITVNSFKTNQSLSNTLFTFNAKKYEDKGYYIIRN
ncbi:outer membrane lipoprotein carrier protein LolA [Flagellimonas sp. CMM7]|uniref:LolA family protein n=1 Tax=Flagellimonas sp. CMM7 TaxID=2654676 RepID=UPI0013D18DBC|nr:outer membrane lipoprotein carrier protein LolA [Flagellimonas sp. CMM7]UII79340.1 outer membrane lipoprotein carrier protein LolA [Flagellimonas sp. CMM7]